jgi:hypothetical protein
MRELVNTPRAPIGAIVSAAAAAAAAYAAAYAAANAAAAAADGVTVLMNDGMAQCNLWCNAGRRESCATSSAGCGSCSQSILKSAFTSVLHVSVFPSEMATQSSAKPDYLIKLMIIGNSCSGKGKLMYQFAQVNHPIQPVHSAMATLVLDSAEFQIRHVEIGGARC